MFKTRVLLDSVKNDPIRKAELVKETVNTIALVPDLLERTEYVSQCAHLLDVPEEALASELAKAINLLRQKGYEEERKQEVPSATPDESQQSQEITVPSAPVPITPPAHPSERHLIQLLLNDGDKTLSQSVTADDGTVQEYTYTVAQCIVADLQNDGLSFSDPLCQRIFDYFADAVNRGEVPDASYFISVDDEALRSFAISLMLDTWRISDTWRQKQIFVPTLEDNLQLDLTETILCFKEKCIDDRIADNARRLREVKADDEDNLMMLLVEKKNLIEIRRQLGAALNRVID